MKTSDLFFLEEKQTASVLMHRQIMMLRKVRTMVLGSRNMDRDGSDVELSSKGNADPDSP